MRTLVVLPTYNEIPTSNRCCAPCARWCPVRHAGRGRRQSRRHRALAEEVGEDSARSWCSNVEPKAASAARTAPASPGDSSTTTTTSSRSTAISLTTPRVADAAGGGRGPRSGHRLALHQGRHIPKWVALARLLSRGGNEYASMMLGLKVADSTSGYRVYSKSALEKIDYQTVTADGYGFQIEMTYRARAAAPRSSRCRSPLRTANSASPRCPRPSSSKRCGW
jgi:hypothetical protein